MKVRSWLMVVVALGSGVPACMCNKNADVGAAADAGASATPSGTVAAVPATPTDGGGLAVAPWLAVPSATAGLLPNMSIPERFQVEASSRPTAKPKAEEVFASLKAAGLTIADEKQHLASPFGARYCVGGRAVSGTTTLLQLSVCEYVTPDVARTSAAYSEQSMKTLMPDRTVRAHKHLALILRPDAKTEEATAAMTKAQATFAGL